MAEKWENAGRIKGDKGDKGDQGEPGQKGEQGDPGKDGSNGTDGKDGTNGKDGKDGKAGNPLIIKGSYDSVDDLPTTGEPGDAYIVDGDLYVWGDF